MPVGEWRNWIIPVLRSGLACAVMGIGTESSHMNMRIEPVRSIGHQRRRAGPAPLMEWRTKARGCGAESTPDTARQNGNR